MILASLRYIRLEEPGPQRRMDPSEARAAERHAAKFPLDLDLHFAASRRHIRDALIATDEGKEINEIVFELIG